MKSKQSRSFKSIFNSKNSILYLLVITFESLVVIGLTSAIVGLVQKQTGNLYDNQDEENETLQAQLKSFPVFLFIILFGLVYTFLLTVDALYHVSILQLVAINIFQIFLICLSALQLPQASEAIGMSELYLALLGLIEINSLNNCRS